jgi:hypothetical protein
MSKNHTLLVFLFSLFFTLNASADYIDGQRAYASGDYGVAILEWTQVAEDGNARAQYNLGWMHANAKGTCKILKRPSSGIQNLPNRGMLMHSITWVTST